MCGREQWAAEFPEIRFCSTWILWHFEVGMATTSCESGESGGRGCSPAPPRRRSLAISTGNPSRSLRILRLSIVLPWNVYPLLRVVRMVRMLEKAVSKPWLRVVRMLESVVSKIVRRFKKQLKTKQTPAQMSG